MKTNPLSRSLLCGIAALAMLCSCSQKKWSAQGTLTSAPEDAELIVEAPNAAGQWYGLDTVKVASDGRFTVKGEAIGHPELLRLRLDNQMVYFPIDSLESITITADAANLQGTAKLEGSESADRMQQANDLIRKAVAEKGVAEAPFDPQLKRELAQLILRDPADVVSYYIVFHSIGNARIFSPDDRSDLRIIGAVANAYTQHRPADPRTPMLKELYLNNRKALGINTGTTMVAQEVRFPEINLMDEEGNLRSLTEAANKGNVVVLCFTAYGAEGASALNIALNNLFSANRSRGLDIYQVSVDPDEFQWKQSAKNLPWTTVYNSPKDGAQVLVDYNVDAIPALYIINRNGDLVERVDDINRLNTAVAKYL